MVAAMRIETLYEFIVVAHYLNFTTAANNLHISQPNLSKHISEIENELGFELITRGKPLRLTAAGTAFLEDAIQVHHKYKDAVKRCQDIATKTIEELVIQEPYIIDAMSEILYKSIMRFKAENPYVSSKLITERGKKSVESLEAGKLDIALTVDCNSEEWITKISEKKSLIFIPVIEEPLVVWMQKDHPLTKRQSIKLEDLIEYTINMTATRSFDPVRFAILDLFKVLNARPRFQSYSVETLNEFFMITNDKSAVFLITPMVAQSPILQMQQNMASAPLDDPRARITSYLVLKDDYGKQSIDVFLSTVEKTIEYDIVHGENNIYLSDFPTKQKD